MTLRRRLLAAGAPVVAALLLLGCAAEKPKPVPLAPVTPRIAGKQVWSKDIGSIGFPLSVAVRAGTFTVASDDGTVVALEAESGRELWRAKAGERLSAGVGSDGRYAAVVTRDGEVVTFDAGKPAWRKPVGVRVVTAPLVAGERVFVLGIDRSVQAFDAADGRKLWTTQRPGDPLTLSQAGVLTTFDDTLVVGQGVRLQGLDPLTGVARWDIAAASPRGTNEVERLADLVGPASRVLDSLCVRAFQSAVTCVNGARGIVVWSKNAGGTAGLGGDAQYVYGVDASSRLTAWSRVTGDVIWTSDKFLHHGLVTPLSTGTTVVYGDAQGLVHWLSRDKGEELLRLPTDGSAVVAAPVASGATMLVVTARGGLHAFRPE